jgi:transposase
MAHVPQLFRAMERTPGNGISLLEEALKNVVGEVRPRSGRLEKPSFIIVDAQSVKRADTAEEKGYDGGKRVSGIKRHLALDTQGLPNEIHVTTGNSIDRVGALEAFSLHQTSLGDVTNVLADAGDTGNNFADSVRDILGCSVEIAKRSELHTFAVIPTRWVVERSFAWLDTCRRLWKNCERNLQTSLNMAVLAFLILCINGLRTGSKVRNRLKD